MAEIRKRSNVAVLFVLIGWAQRYDGTESVIGGAQYLIDNPDRGAERQAFVTDINGYYCCGIGEGKVAEPSLDVVFIARNINNNLLEAVGLYSNVTVTCNEKNWGSARTKQAILFPPGNRPIITNYPAGRGMRRWARRIKDRGNTWAELLSAYDKLKTRQRWDTTTLTPEELEFSAFEGELQTLFKTHRKRESKLRSAKIRDTLKNNAGILKCEVPRCGFNFHEKYGLFVASNGLSI